MKIQEVLKVYSITSTGFPAVAGLGEHSNENGKPAVLSTLPASVLAEQGITQYFAPRFERGQVFESTEEIIEANIEVDAYEIEVDFSPKELRELTLKKNTVIVSRHAGTIEILKGMYPSSKVLDGNVTSEDINGKHVIGTLPPFLITAAGIYTPVTIKDFDYNVDGDLSGDELDKRLVIGDPFTLKSVESPKLPETLAEVIDFFTDNYGFVSYYEEVEYPFGAYKEYKLEDMLDDCDEVVKYLYKNADGYDFSSTAVLDKDNELHILMSYSF